MSSRAIKSKEPSCLLDCITPKNKLLSVRTTKIGFRFEYRDKKLPACLFEAAAQLGFSLIDDDPGRPSGRLVSLVDSNSSQ